MLTFFVLVQIIIVLKKVVFCSNYFSDHEYINEKNEKIFASLGTIVLE